MKLVKLAMRGLRSFADTTEIDFARLGEQGLFAIVGPTGAGKSTVLDGVFLALFGRSPRGEASDCVAPGATELFVRLEISLRDSQTDGSPELAIERRWRWSKKRDASETEVRGAPRHAPVRVERKAGGGWLPVDFAGLAPEVFLRERIVKISIGDFQQAVVLPQGEFGALLGARPKERRQLVASLFRTEHLGEPLALVLRQRESEVKGEIERLGEAQREVSVSEEDAEAARGVAAASVSAARELQGALGRGERFATEVRRARERCVARDEAKEGLVAAETEAARREVDRARAAMARRAAGAAGAIDELDAAEASAAEADAEDRETKRAAQEATATLRAAQRELSDARAARDADIDSLSDRLEKARFAVERSRAAEIDRAEWEARRGALAKAVRASDAARTTLEGSAEALARQSEAARKAALEHEEARVDEAERAEALAEVAVAERRDAERRRQSVEADERVAAARAVEIAEQEAETARESARAAETTLNEAATDLSRLEIDAARAIAEIDMAVRTLEDARRAEAAADLAERLRDGMPCPVCGAREHPGVDHRGPSAFLAAAERTVDAAQRTALFMTKLRDEAGEHARASGEALRAATSRLDDLSARAEADRSRLARLEAGHEVPRAVTEADSALARAAARADLALAAVAEETRERIAGRPVETSAAERRVAEVSARARAADALGLRARAARDRELAAERETSARRATFEEAARARAAAEASEEAAARTSTASAREVEALLVAIQPPGQHDLFTRTSWPRDAIGWTKVLAAQIDALVRRADAAEVALELARADADRLSLAAREASGRRVEANRALSRARAAAASALARTGFADAELVRNARLDPDALAELEGRLAEADAALSHARAVFQARARDVDVEVDAAGAAVAEEALDEARRRANAAADEAATARERATELTRRRARALEIGARIEALSPRVERLARLKHVTQGGLLSELAAERHLQAVTRVATELLGGLSQDRYALVRRADGSFGVRDAAHGGLVRAPSSLSGGETFLVSLSLALSLSERIQIAGRTRFDFFFLDEGFGSLDATTLDVALGALERLRDAGRVIGVISHVPSVEERMPCRLRVVPGRPPGRSRVVLEMG